MKNGLKKRLILCVISIGLLFSTSARANQIIWDPTSIEIVLTPGTARWEQGSVGEPCVIYEDGVYKMWYRGSSGGTQYTNIYGIGYATSIDGVNWTSRQIVHGPVTHYYQMGTPEVMKEGTTYRMWHHDYYEWIAGDWSSYISHLSSSDGISWTDEQKVLSAQGQSNPQGDGYCVQAPSVLKEGSQYIMWYSVADHPRPGVGGPSKIWRTTSNDGINWENRQLALPYIRHTWEDSVGGSHVVKESEGDYIMYYSAWDGETTRLARARSSDGINWTDREQILSGGGSPFYFQDPTTERPYLYFTQGNNIVRMRGIREPIPDIKANGSDGTIILSPGDTLVLSLNLKAKDYAGENADWWLVAQKKGSNKYYSYYRGRWVRGIRPFLQASIGDFSYEWRKTDLPQGSYIFYWGVDLDMNGSVDYDQLYKDSVCVKMRKNDKK